MIRIAEAIREPGQSCTASPIVRWGDICGVEMGRKWFRSDRRRSEAIHSPSAGTMKIAQFPSVRPRRGTDWANEDLAQFYRVEASLIQAGISVETDRGVTDEGEPWFVF